MLRTHRKLGIAAALVAAVALSVGAYAYWTQAGGGSGTAGTGTTSAITVVQTATSPAALYPGGAAVVLSGTFTNPNPGPVYVNDVTATGITSVTGANIDATHPCTSADFALAGTASVDAEILANDTSTWSGLTIQLLDTGANQDGCKDATVTIAYSSN